MKLQEIAKINPGLVTTRKKASIKFEIEEVYKVLTLNAVDDYGTIDREKLTDFESIEKLSDQYFYKEGDILVRLNEPYTAIYIDKSKENILIPSYFVKIEINNKSFKAGYIAWYLNSAKVKRDFLISQSGTLVPSINQKVIRDLDIPIKTIEEQENILSLLNYILKSKPYESAMFEREKQFNGFTEELLKKQEVI